MKVFKCRGISRGYAKGNVIVSSEPISFYGGVDPYSGIVVEKGHPLEGLKITGRILVFPHGKGSTVGSYVLLRLAKRGLAPLAIINLEAEPIVVVGAIISNIPMVDKLPPEFFEDISTGMYVIVDADNEEVRIP